MSESECSDCSSVKTVSLNDVQAESHLEIDQLRRLSQLLSGPVPVTGQHPYFGSIQVVPWHLCASIRQACQREGIEVADVRLEGSAAAYCAVAPTDSACYSVPYVSEALVILHAAGGACRRMFGAFVLFT
jgi:hypothetical protein